MAESSVVTNMVAPVVPEPTSLRALLLRSLVEVQMLRQEVQRDIERCNSVHAAAGSAATASTTHELQVPSAGPQEQQSQHIATAHAIGVQADVSHRQHQSMHQPEGRQPCEVSVFANLLYQASPAPAPHQHQPDDGWGGWVAAGTPARSPLRAVTCTSPTHSTPTSSEARALAFRPTIDPESRPVQVTASLGHTDGHVTRDQDVLKDQSSHTTPTKRCVRSADAAAQDTPLHQALHKLQRGSAGATLCTSSHLYTRAASPHDQRGTASEGALPLVYATTATVTTARTSQGLPTGELSALLDAQQGHLRLRQSFSAAATDPPRMQHSLAYEPYPSWQDSGSDSDDTTGDERMTWGGSGAGHVRTSAEWGVQKSTCSFDPRLLLKADDMVGGIAGWGSGGVARGQTAVRQPGSPCVSPPDASSSPDAHLAAMQRQAAALGALTPSAHALSSRRLLEDVSVIPQGKVSASLRALAAERDSRQARGGQRNVAKKLGGFFGRVFGPSAAGQADSDAYAMGLRRAVSESVPAGVAYDAAEVQVTRGRLPGQLWQTQEVRTLGSKVSAAGVEACDTHRDVDWGQGASADLRTQAQWEGVAGFV